MTDQTTSQPDPATQGSALNSDIAKLKDFIQKAKAEEATLEQRVTVHPVIAVVIAILCGLPVGVVLAWVPPLRDLTKLVVGH